MTGLTARDLRSRADRNIPCKLQVRGALLQVVGKCGRWSASADRSGVRYSVRGSTFTAFRENMSTSPSPSDRAPSVPGSGSTSRAFPRWTGWAVVFALVVLALAIIANVRVISLDIFHEMALFRAVLDRGGIPTDDIFAYTPTISPSVHHEWAMGAILYVVTVTLGLGAHGLVLLRLVLLGAVVACCVTVARRRGAGGVEMAAAAPLAILLFWPGLSPVRAHMVTFALLGLLLYLLETDREGSRWWLIVWPFAFVAWLNIHGGFVVGLGLLGLYALEQSVRRWRKSGRWSEALGGSWHLWAATAGTLPLLLLNPYGLDYIPYLWHALLLDRPLIPEWSPLWAPGFRGIPLAMYLASVLILAYTLLRGRYWKDQPGILLVLAAAAAALDSVRILPIYMIVWMCYLPPALVATPLGEMLRRIWRRRARAIGSAALAAGGVGLWTGNVADAFTVILPTEGPGYRQHYPAGAVEYLRDVGFQGNLMTPFGVGAFVSWHLYPDVKVGMDSRYEVAYPPELVEETMRIYQGEGDWREFLGRYPTDAVLAPARSPLTTLLDGAADDEPPRWIEVYRDDAYAIFAAAHIAATLPRVDRRGKPIPGRFP